MCWKFLENLHEVWTQIAKIGVERVSGYGRLRFSGLSWVVTVTFQNIAACKLLFFVKNKGQWNAKSGPKVGDGKVVCEKNLRDVWCRNESVRAEIGPILQTHTHTRVSYSSIDILASISVLHYIKIKGKRQQVGEHCVKDTTEEEYYLKIMRSYDTLLGEVITFLLLLKLHLQSSVTLYLSNFFYLVILLLFK